ncbi:MAG: P1 family peptidase [Asticcacaulis sp.]
MSCSPGPRNAISDIAGLRVGHAQDDHVRSGVTVLIAATAMTAAIDVRGGGPGVRESEALKPENLVGKADAIVFAGGSVFGLAAADGVTALLSAAGQGLHLKPGSPAIPIVPAAVLHDLANGGDKAWDLDPPYRRLGIEAAQAAAEDFALGSVGAGLGAMAGTLKGGIGTASLDLGGGLIVGALVAANPVGAVHMPDSDVFWAWPWEIDGEFGGARPAADVKPAADPVPDLSRLSSLGRLAAGVNTTLAIVACTADLTTAEAKRFAMMAQDGMSRAVRPAHTPFDGDVVFALASGEVALDQGPSRAVQLARLGSAAADCLARAIARGVWEALHARV